MSAKQLATVLKAPANRTTQIVKGERAVTADTARRLGKFFCTTPESWMNLQMIHELDRDRKENAKGREIESIPCYCPEGCCPA